MTWFNSIIDWMIVQQYWAVPVAVLVVIVAGTRYILTGKNG